MPSNSSSHIEILSGIWQRVLGCQPLTGTDNFFDLGGNPSLACQLFEEITSVLGSELPPTILYDAPTFGALAELLGRSVPPRLSPLAMLRPGDDKTPIFVFHGLGSGILEFFELMKYLRTARAVYGLQAKGTDGMDRPAAHVEDMAEFGFHAIRDKQNHGPYTLVGYSLGGLVALEIARRLMARGEEIALLLMIDSFPSVKSLRPREHAHLLRIQMAYRLSDSIRALKGEQRRTPLAHVKKRAAINDSLAVSRYRPNFYGGKVIFVRPEHSRWPDPVQVWTPLVGEFVVERVPGDHHTSLSMYSENLGSLLSQHVEGSPQLQSVR